MYSSKDNKSFQNKVSMDGQLRNLDTSDAIHTYEQTDVKTKTEQNEHDCRD